MFRFTCVASEYGWWTQSLIFAVVWVNKIADRTNFNNEKKRYLIEIDQYAAKRAKARKLFLLTWNTTYIVCFLVAIACSRSSELFLASYETEKNVNLLLLLLSPIIYIFMQRLPVRSGQAPNRIAENIRRPDKNGVTLTETSHMTTKRLC